MRRLFSLLLLTVATGLTLTAAPSDNVTIQSPSPSFTWHDVDPGVRKYLILVLANTLSIQSQYMQTALTPQQQFDIMEQVIDSTPTDCLSGDYLSYITESNKINRRMIAVFRKENPSSASAVRSIRHRFEGEINALNRKYPNTSRFFTREAQARMSQLLTDKTGLRRVMEQARKDGKSPQEILRLAGEHLRKEAEQQQ